MVKEIKGMDKKFGLVGRNIAYSFSRGYFAEKFKTQGLQGYSYENFDLSDLQGFKAMALNTPGLCGLNVTIPYKEAIIAQLDAIDPVAEAIGAVNTIKVNNGKLHGYNTDAHGFEVSLVPHLHTGIKKALVLGTGGASKAVMHTLNKLGIEAVSVSRNPHPGQIAYSALNKEIIDAHLLIVNCTPLGTFPEVSQKPDLPYDLITEKHLLYDLIYNPEETAFLKEGKTRKARIANGYRMLVEQAEKSWEIWNS
ncbi:shikimate dehydrogenase [Robertkochia sp. 1368]|nr:shikimate dehydrogenase [Robertkochia sediminum]